MKYGQISLRFYIRGDAAAERAQNLKALGREHFPTPDGKGNFSEMVNDALNKQYNLDPATGRPLKAHSSK